MEELQGAWKDLKAVGNQGPGERQESPAEETQDAWRDMETEKHQGPGERQERLTEEL